MTAFNAPPSVRADLSEFEHFVCVEDLRNDFNCRLDYRQMFSESKYVVSCCRVEWTLH